MDAEKVAELKLFINRCKSNPSLLHDPSVAFLKDYLQSLGAKIPGGPELTDDMKNGGNNGLGDDYLHTKKTNPKVEIDVEDEIVESDLELEDEIVEPENDPPQKMGDPTIEVSEESRDAAQSYKGKAMDAISEGKFEEAISNLTEAILLNPNSAILYATRASAFLKLNKPNAAMRDADAALQINPDSAKGYKARGMAKAMLGRWKEAASDLHLASKLDYDEEISLILKKVEPNLHKIEEHRKKYERLRQERERKKIQRDRQHQHADTEAAYKRERQQSFEVKASRDAGSDDAAALASLNDGKVISIHSSSELQTKLEAASKLSRLAILYFTATWCGPCRFMAPVFSSLAEKHPEVVFLKVDIDELSDVARRWNVSSVPTFFFLKNSNEVDKFVGADENGLERKIALHAGKP